MTKFQKMIILALLATSFLYAGAFEKTAKSRATQITISSEKPLSSGYNTIDLQVLNDSYKDSEVSMKIFMPAMPGMPYMETITNTKSLGSGKHQAKVNLPMGGTWQVHIFLKPKIGKKVRVKTSINI